MINEITFSDETNSKKKLRDEFTYVGKKIDKLRSILHPCFED